ncbi:MAG: FdhF/YdeP family oxidoreductase [Sphingomonadales bacterium]|nr:FdhF/YdeP family oxidoreductase [Sphingomonadales bacterium]NCQ21338.1 FdhF/YdeP family oxidoreductase [Sphingomonadales bacterium]NCT03501.1 FdhF/YdeP family oxidoreductase [Sphingomonadales bacterium]
MAGDLPTSKRYRGATGGWGSVEGIARVELTARASPSALLTLKDQNKPGGYMCASCAWTKPEDPLAFEFCENGAKATLWDLTRDRCTPEVLAQHTVTELRAMGDYALEMLGRLTEPVRYNPATDRYERADWNTAFAEIGAQLRSVDPQSVTFYASGKAALEPSYLYALFARAYGHNNLPDSSNMCHETTSVGLKKVIGSSVGTCQMEDFDHVDAIFYLGQNPGTNSPRILHPLKSAVERGCKIIVFNPLKEKGLREFVDPQNPVQMTVGNPTKLDHQYCQVRSGGDIAALMGVCKHVIAMERARGPNDPAVLDHAFIAQHTTGLDDFMATLDAADWADLERASGLARAEMEAAGRCYAQAKNVMGIYGMGLTQHVHGSQAIGMLVNLLLLRGNIGRKGTGCSPIRGHSNVQGQRTVGITEKVHLAPVEKYRELFDLETPERDGHNTVAFLEAVCDGSAKAFIGLGGNLANAVPDHVRVHEAWRNMELTVHVATKLNTTHCLPGQASWILPCLVRAEIDEQASGHQWVSMEDSFSHISGSRAYRTPASDPLLSETAIVCGLAKATLGARHPKLTWDAWQADYSRIRDAIAATYPDEFADMNGRMTTPGGFFRGNAARERVWKTQSGKAEFTAPTVLNACGVGDAEGRFHLVTLRSNDQFNTTIYGHDDRLRGLSGSRMIVLMKPSDMQAAGLAEGDTIALVTDAGDAPGGAVEAQRKVAGLKVVPYDLPTGTLAGYFPELNPLVPLWYHEELSQTPASKGVPVRIERT